jgi:hypothetical protein
MLDDSARRGVCSVFSSRLGRSVRLLGKTFRKRPSPPGRNQNLVSGDPRKHFLTPVAKKPSGGTRELAEDKGGRMIGVDILHLPRISALLNRRVSYAQRFMQRILHPTERSEVPTEKSLLTRYLATRYGTIFRVLFLMQICREGGCIQGFSTGKESDVEGHGSMETFKRY